MAVRNFKSIVFDLGNVILNVKDRYESISPSDQVKNRFESLVDIFELGKMDSNQFVDYGSKMLDMSFDQFMFYWCGLIKDFPPARINLLFRLSRSYNIYLLSNTNILHRDLFQMQFYHDNNFEFDTLFSKVYYSDIVGVRKPSHLIFNHVLVDNKISAHETLFIDDLQINIDAAASAGFITYHKTNIEIEHLDFDKKDFL